MLDPIITTIEVPCNQEKAFGVFANEMGEWWPLDKRSMSMHSGASAKSLRVEAKEGGKIVEIGHDDTEHLWGTITAYDPHDSIRMDFHMGCRQKTRAWSKCGSPPLAMSEPGSNSPRAIGKHLVKWPR